MRPVPARRGVPLEHRRCRECHTIFAWEPWGVSDGHRATALNPPGGCWTVCEAPQEHLSLELV